MKDVKVTFLVTLKQIGLKGIILILLGSILVPSILVIREQKNINAYQDEKLISFGEEGLLEKLRILNEYTGPEEKEKVDELKKEVEKDLLKLEMYEKYDIISSEDPRYYDVMQWVNLQDDFDKKSQEEQEKIKVQLDELEYQISLNYRDKALQKIEELKGELEDLKSLPEEEKQKKIEALTAEIELRKYETISEINLFHSNIGMVKKAYFSLASSLEEPMTEDSFYQNPGMLETYSNYEEYLNVFLESKNTSKKQYDYVMEELRLGIQESSYDNNYIQHFKMQDGLFTIFSYITIVTIICLFITVYVFHTDYDNHMIIQYKVHMPLKHYLLGKYLVMIVVLLFSLVIGLVTTGTLSYLLSPGYLPKLLLTSTSSGFVAISFPLWYLLQILFLFLLAVLCIICTGMISTTELPRSVIYFILILFVGVCFYFTNRYTMGKLDILKYIPFTYLRYSKICYRHLLPKELTVIYQMLVLVVISIVAAWFMHKKTVS